VIHPGILGVPAHGREEPMTTASHLTPGAVRSLIPARIDRLPWSPFHTRMVIALGVAWILDGLEITVASAVGDVLNKPETLNLSSTAIGFIATVYLVGEVVGALVFGRMSDKLGRRNLFMITLGVYLVGSGLTALSPARASAVNMPRSTQRSTS
jgi:Major Facilitator Superfamily